MDEATEWPEMQGQLDTSPISLSATEGFLHLAAEQRTGR